MGSSDRSSLLSDASEDGMEEVIVIIFFFILFNFTHNLLCIA